jgi:hypothetical protein
MVWYPTKAVCCGKRCDGKYKKEFEKIQKVLDSLVEMCYLNKVAANDKRIASRKTLKKVLDKRDEVWYSSKAPPMRRVPCKLNNVTNEKHQTEQSFGTEPRVA